MRSFFAQLIAGAALSTLAPAVSLADPELIAGQRGQAAAYEVGVADWAKFKADGWTLRSPGKGELGIIKLSGTLEGTLDIVLGVVEEPFGFSSNPPELTLQHALPQMEFGIGTSFEAGYFKSEPLRFPDGRVIGGENLAKPVCKLVFEARILKENTCGTP